MARRFFHWLDLSQGPIEGRVLDAHLSAISVDDMPRVPDTVPGTYTNPTLDINHVGQVVGAANGSASGSSRVFTHSTSVPSVGLGESDLYTDTLPAGLFAANGDIVTFHYHHAFTASGTIKFYVDGNVVFNTGSLTSVSGESLHLTIQLIRVDATTLVMTWQEDGNFDLKTSVPITTSPITVTLSGAIAVKTTATTVGAAAVTATAGWAIKDPA